MNHDGTKLERLTLKAGDNENPTFSPNGYKILYSSNRIGSRDVKGRSQLYMTNYDGSSQTKIETGMYEAISPNWGPNAR